jgi:hypothetical protein
MNRPDLNRFRLPNDDSVCLDVNYCGIICSSLISGNRSREVSSELFLADGFGTRGRTLLQKHLRSREGFRQKGDVMHSLQATLDALEKARTRKQELKELLKNLTEQCRLVKQEVKMHEKRVEAMMREREYVEYLDTLRLDQQLRFLDE